MFDLFGIVHASARPAGTLGQVSAAADLVSFKITPSILLPIAGIALGARPSAARGEVSGVHLLGFRLPFQLLLDEVELLILLLPELLSQVLSLEQPAYDEGLVLTEEDALEVALLALESPPNFVVLVVVALFLV